jgi:hypothetical protein
MVGEFFFPIDAVLMILLYFLQHPGQVVYSLAIAAFLTTHVRRLMTVPHLLYLLLQIQVLLP